MKFKDLEVGDVFRCTNWKTTHIKIAPVVSEAGLTLTHQEIGHGAVRFSFVKDNDTVFPVRVEGQD